MTSWQPVIGLEIHVQLKTRTKMFCRCENVWGAEENTRTCPVCLAHPGALPVPNGRAIEWAIRLGQALGCTIAERSLFHRKNYFYPDLSKGYQISQYDSPLCTGGAFAVPTEQGGFEVGITRAHLEEDAAKSVHVGGEQGRIAGAETSLVDFNRGGTPLVEIVTEPDLHDVGEAKLFLQLLRQTVVELGISHAEMEKGSLRCDANVSVREVGEEGFRTKTELKNMNSFTFVARGIEAEIERQIGIYDGGGVVEQETLHFDPQSGRLSSLRSKEEAHDYRYLPEPDLVAIEPGRARVETIAAELPESPAARLGRLQEAHGLSFYDAQVLNGSRGVVALYEQVVAAGADAKASANVLQNQFAAAGVDPTAVDASELAEVISARDTLPRETFDTAIAKSGDADFKAAPYVADAAVTDTGELEPLIDSILEAHPEQVATYKGGKEGLLGFFVGQVMKETQGKADARVVNELVRAKLAE